MKAIVVNKIKSPIKEKKIDGLKNEKLEKLEADTIKLREKLLVNSKILENYKKQKKFSQSGIEELKIEINSNKNECIL